MPNRLFLKLPSLLPGLLPSLFSGLLLAACAVPQAPAPVQSATVPSPGQILPYSFRTQAFDGTRLWQLLREEGKSYLISQSLQGEGLRRIQLAESLPPHRSLAWGRGKLWILDYDDRLYQIDPATGKLLSKQSLDGLPEARASEQIAWSGDELWLLMRSYVSAANRLETARFLRIDPATATVRETRVMPGEVNSQPRPSIGFSDFVHQNLIADHKAFYVLRSALYEPQHNLLYRIDRQTLAVSHTKLSRIYTGVPTLFFWQGKPYGVELLDTNNCGEFCRGKLEAFPNP